MAESDFGTAPEETLEDLATAQDTAASDAGTTTGDERPQEEESFVDPATLPPELKAHWKRMHGAFTKRMMETKEARQAAELVQRFNNDPAFAAQVLQQRAQQLGFTLQRPGQAQPSATAFDGSADEPPAELIQAMMAETAPELQWMVPGQAKAFWRVNRQMLAPMLSQFQRQQQETLNDRHQALEAEMDEHYPIWRESEAELSELDRFLRSDQLKHPKYGNRLALLYRALKADALGTAAATRRMAEAGRNRTTTGRSGATQTANVAEQVMKAKNPTEAFRAAARAAIENPGGA